jgi:competence/damage-inducible protein CinA-like protein
MPSAEIITIGTEILLGDIIDTNARFIALALRNAGIDLFRKTTVGDNPGRISVAIQESMERCDIIITTGGLGPTVDDPTRDAVALAMGVDTEFRPELWEQIQARFQRYNRQPTENNRRQAYIPKGAIAIENPVGTAPAFIVEKEAKSIIALPGVPSEMEYLLTRTVLPYLRERYQINSIIKNRILHTAGVGESQIDQAIGDLEILSNPTVGLAAHSGQVDVRITVKAESESQADEMISGVEVQLRQRLGRWIYGADKETLEGMALDALGQKGWSLAVMEAGLAGELTRRLASVQRECFRGGEILSERPAVELLPELTEAFRSSRQADVGLGVAIYPAKERQEVHLVLITPQDQQIFNRPYGGPPEYAPRWATHHSLDIIRNL